MQSGKSAVTRNSYSLFQRKTGAQTVWYARFWDDELQAYSSGRSTGQTTKPAANRQVQKWLTEGLPEASKRNPSVSQKRILTAISKHLCETGTIDKTDKIEPEELIKLFYNQVANHQMSSTEGFVDYLLRFWDWNGDYVRGRLERKKSIGKKYVDNCRSIVTMHIAPYFKDMSLADVTTLSLENFMQSIPRRDDDPENGYSRRTINIMMKTIKKPLADAVRLRIIPRNPADGVELLADDTRERGIVTPSELERLFQLEWADERGKAASILAAVSGMRLSEITGLQINNLDKTRNIIHVLHSYTTYEKRLKTTKTGKTRIIYTDSSIINLLADLHTRNPFEGTYIFWGLEPNKPIRSETVEKYLEGAFSTLLGEEVRNVMTKEWKEIAQNLASFSDLQNNEVIAIQNDNIDTAANCIRINHSYTINNRKLDILYSKERTIMVKAPILQKLTSFFTQEPYVFIFGGLESSKQIDIANLNQKEINGTVSCLGEIVRRERNLSFHGFRHFFNSTIRGSVSDDILRLQTGHLDEKMTDLYDHMTDDRGEQLRKAVQAKILPFIPKAMGE